MDEIAVVVEKLRRRETVAVGIGVPAVVEFATGRAKWSVHVKLADVPLRALLEDRLGLPVFVDNDTTCAALAEAHDGARMVVRNLVMVAVGTGVGGGLVLAGRVSGGDRGRGRDRAHPDRRGPRTRSAAGPRVPPGAPSSCSRLARRSTRSPRPARALPSICSRSTPSIGSARARA